MHLSSLPELGGAPVRAGRIYVLVRDLMQTGGQVLLRVSEGIRFGGQL
jgi:hypothetical protein